jgi:gas vesicle GvpC-like protein
MERIKQEHQSIANQVAQLQQNAQNLLKNMNENRVEMAEKQGMELQEFHQDLREKTAHFLNVTTAKREEMSQQQTRELQQFNQELQQKTADFLTGTNLIRQENAQQQTMELQQFNQELQQKTADFLTETRLKREEMSEKQKMNLQKFVQSLRDSIWGVTKEVEVKVKPAVKTEIKPTVPPVQKTKVVVKKPAEIPQILTEDSWLLPGDMEDENTTKETVAKKLVSRRLSGKDAPGE